jgi:hypothetical protein
MNKSINTQLKIKLSKLLNLYSYVPHSLGYYTYLLKVDGTYTLSDTDLLHCTKKESDYFAIICYVRFA